MTPSILTIAQEGLRLAEAGVSTAGTTRDEYAVAFTALQRHARNNYATLCRELLRLHEENERLRTLAKEAVGAFQRYGVHPNNELEICGLHNGVACDCGLFAKNKRFIDALAQTGEKKT